MSDVSQVGSVKAVSGLIPRCSFDSALESSCTLTYYRLIQVSDQQRNRDEQLELKLQRGWGGRRSGAGRKPTPGRRSTAHRARPRHRAYEPVHVTLRSALRSLRSQYVFPTLRQAIAQAARLSPEFRVVHFSVQVDHVHLLVEATNTAALSAGMRGLVIRIARQVNKLLFRRGRVWTARWHGRALTSPRAVRHALVYVLANFRKHLPSSRHAVDPCSSAPYFDGFREYQGRAPIELLGTTTSQASRADLPPVSRATTWLLAQSWRKRSLSVHERPSST